MTKEDALRIIGVDECYYSITLRLRAHGRLFANVDFPERANWCYEAANYIERLEHDLAKKES